MAKSSIQGAWQEAVLLRYRSPMTLCLPFLTAVLLGSAASAGATEFPRREPIGFTWGELAVLPEYCKDTQGTVWDTRGNGGPMAPDTPKWVSLMGDDFFHAHHYCYGLRHMLRAQSAGESTPRGKDLLRRALGEFAYMFRSSRSTMPLMPEIYLKEGEVHLKLGNVLEAGQSFERSRLLNASYWPAYTRWADVLIGLKQFESARKLLQDGLAHSPNEPELTRRLALLDRTPAPAPRPAAAARASKASASAALAVTP